MADKKDHTKLLNDFLAEHDLGIQIQPQRIRRMEDGGIVIDPSVISVGKLPKDGKNGKTELGAT